MDRTSNRNNTSLVDWCNSDHKSHCEPWGLSVRETQRAVKFPRERAENGMQQDQEGYYNAQNGNTTETDMTMKN